MAYCVNCGSKLAEGVKYCTACGTKVVMPQLYGEATDNKSECSQEASVLEKRDDNADKRNESMGINAENYSNPPKKKRANIGIIVSIVAVVLIIGFLVGREIVLYSGVWGTWERTSTIQLRNGSDTNGRPSFAKMKATIVLKANRKGTIEFSLVDSDEVIRKSMDSSLIYQLDKQGKSYISFMQTVRDDLKEKSKSFKFFIKGDVIYWNGTEMGKFKLEDDKIIFVDGDINDLYNLFEGTGWEHDISFEKVK